MRYVVLLVSALIVAAVIEYGRREFSKGKTRLESTYDGAPEDHRGEKLLVVAIWAKWAAAWKTSEGVLETLDLDRFDLMTLNADEHVRLVRDLGVEIVPTVLVFENGSEIRRIPNFDQIELLP